LTVDIDLHAGTDNLRCLALRGVASNGSQFSHIHTNSDELCRFCEVGEGMERRRTEVQPASAIVLIPPVITRRVSTRRIVESAISRPFIVHGLENRSDATFYLHA